jgi:hypothetical protein
MPPASKSRDLRHTSASSPGCRVARPWVPRLLLLVAYCEGNCRLVHLPEMIGPAPRASITPSRPR